MAGAALVLAAACAAPEPSASGVAYVEETSGAEDLVALPGSRWLIASGLAQPSRPGTLHLVDRAARTATRADSAMAFAHDTNAFPDCPGPFNAARFSPHGLSLRPGPGARGTLYATNHGGREAVEAFTVAAGEGAPRLTWIGCVPLPAGAIGNGVASLPGGGLAVSLMIAPEYARAADPMARMSAGEVTGYAAQWFPGRGWSKVPGTEGSGPNGILASPDGRWLWVALWGARQVIRVPRDGQGEKTVLELDLWPDNLRWGEDGAVWAAGAADVAAYMACRAKPGCRAEYAVARIDQRRFRIEPIATPSASAEFGDATSALQVGNELWLAAYPTDRIAVMKLVR